MLQSLCTTSMIWILLVFAILMMNVAHAQGDGLMHEMDQHVNNSSRISRAIEMQYGMEKTVIKTFNKLFANFTRQTEIYTKQVIYLCDESCSTDHAHEYGLTSSFLLSVLSERKFAIKPKNDYSISDFYEQESYSWKLNFTEIANKHGQMILPSLAKHDKVLAALHLLEGELQKMDFEEKFTKDFVTISGNHNWIQDLRRHPKTITKMPWLFRAHACDVIRLLHFGLFRVPRLIKGNINAQLINKVGDNKLICFHGDKNAPVKTADLSEFILGNFRHSTFRIYLSNYDSKAFFDTQYRTGIDLNKLVVDFDLSDLYKNVKHKKNTPVNVNNFRHIVDVHVLVLCDVLITMESHTGLLAAHLRRNSDGLFCYRDGVIYPCTRELIAGSFRDLNNLPKELNKMYYLSNMKQ